MKTIIRLTVAILIAFSVVTPSSAGTLVTARGATLEEAMDNTSAAVEEAARKAKRCVSEYPKAEKCKQLPDGTWECVAIRANQKGSCK